MTDAFKLSAGARYEHVKQQPTAAGNDKFASAHDRDFNAVSASLGALYKLTSLWSVAGNVAYTERAPALYELYANGPHDATGQYLIGNPDAQKKRPCRPTCRCAVASGPNKGSVGVFYSRFKNYLTEFNTGRLVDDSDQVVAPGTDDALNKPSIAAFGRSSAASNSTASGACFRRARIRWTWNSPATTRMRATWTTISRCRAFRRCARRSRSTTAMGRSARVPNCSTHGDSTACPKTICRQPAIRARLARHLQVPRRRDGLARLSSRR